MNAKERQRETDLNTLLSNQYLLGHQLADILFTQQLPTNKILYSEWYSITRQDKAPLTNDEIKISYGNLVFIATKVKSCHLPVLKQIEGTCWFYGAYHALRELVDEIDYVKPLILAMSDQSYQLYEFEHLKDSKKSARNVSIVANNVFTKIFSTIAVYGVSQKEITHTEGHTPVMYLLYFFRKCLISYKCIFINDQFREEHFLNYLSSQKVDIDGTQVLVLIIAQKQKEKFNYTSLCGKSFTLKSSVIMYGNPKHKTDKHAVAGIFCDGQQYIIDSNTDFSVQHNWCEGFDKENPKIIDLILPTRETYDKMGRLFTYDTFIYVKKPEIKSNDNISYLVPKVIRSWFKTPLSSDILSSTDFIKTKIAELHWLILKQKNIYLYDVQLCLSIISQTKQTDFKALNQRFKTMLENLPNNDAYLYLGDALTYNADLCIYDILRRLEILIHAIIKAQTATDSVLKCTTSNDNLRTIFCKVHDYASTINKPLAYLFVYGVGTKELTEMEKKIIVSYIPERNVFACVHMFDYQTKGVKDSFNAFRNAKTVQKGKIVKEHPRVNRLIDQITQLQEFNQYALVLVGISHGALLLQAALTKMRMGSYSEALLKNTFFYSVGSPRLIPSSILPIGSSASLPRVLNYYHEKDPVLKLLSPLQPFVSRFDFPNLTSKTLAEFHYDKSKAIFLYRKSYQNQLIQEYHTGVHLISPTCNPPLLFSTDLEFDTTDFYALYLYDGYVFFNDKKGSILIYKDLRWYVTSNYLLRELEENERKNIKIQSNHRMQSLERLAPKEDRLYMDNKVFSLVAMNSGSFRNLPRNIGREYYEFADRTSLVIYKGKLYDDRVPYLSLSRKFEIKELIKSQKVTHEKHHTVNYFSFMTTVHEFLIGGLFRLFIANKTFGNNYEEQVKKLCTDSSNWNFYKAFRCRDLRDITVNDNDILYDELIGGSTLNKKIFSKFKFLPNIKTYVEKQFNQRYFVYTERTDDKITKELNLLLHVNQVSDAVIKNKDIHLYDNDINVQYILKHVTLDEYPDYSNIFYLYHVYSLHDSLIPTPEYHWIVFPYKQYHAGKPKRKR